MRRLKKSAAALAALVAALAITPLADAQEVTPQFSLGGTDFLKGSEFTVTITEGTCPGGPVSITSEGFAAPVDLTTLRGRFVNSGGYYTATLKCKDTTTEGRAAYVLRDPDQYRVEFLDKDVYAPGETIKINGSGLPSACRSRFAYSEGFVAQVELGRDAGNVPYGEAKAIDTPGDYYAYVGCGIVGDRHDTFTIKVPPPGITPSKPTPKPGPKAPIVKPKGAPQTGGGGTA